MSILKSADPEGSSEKRICTKWIPFRAAIQTKDSGKKRCKSKE